MVDLGRAFCICACITGAMIVIVAGEGMHFSSVSSTSSTNVGWLFLALNVIAGAVYNVLQKQSGVLQKYSPMFVAGVSFLLAACGLFPSACYSATAKDWLLADRLVSQLALAYAAVFVTAYNYSVSAWANKITAPTTVVAFQTLQPVSACILNYAVYGVHLTHAQALGGSAIIVGLLSDILWKTPGQSSTCHMSRGCLVSAPPLPSRSAESSNEERRPLKGLPILVK